MSSKTKIVVLHMKEIIYTGIFLVLGILLIIFLIILFVPGNEDTPASPSPTAETDTTPETEATAGGSSLYIPGVYNTEIVLNDQALNVEVIVDKNGISSIELVNISTAITTMYPLLEPAFDTLTAQILENQSLDNITYSQESKYTTFVLLEAIRKSLDKAQP